MYRLLLTLMLCAVLHPIHAQAALESGKYPVRLLTTEPAIGTRLVTLYTLAHTSDLHFTNLLQYNPHRKVNIMAHTAFSTDFQPGNISDIRQNYSYAVMQKFGLGTSFYTRHSANGFFLVFGWKHQSYSGTLVNSEIPERITSKTSSVTTQYGLMHNLKLGRKKYFFSSRVYVPLKGGYDGILENASLEIGLGIALR